MAEKKSRVLVTGINGFIGSALADTLLSKDYGLSGLVRRQVSLPFVQNIETLIVGELFDLLEDKSERTTPNHLTRALQGVDVVIHTVGRVHVMNDDALDQLAEFRKVNRDITLKLGQLAADSGVKRFMFLSTIKVNGEETAPFHPFKPDDQSVPIDPYGLSKYEAEQGLLALAKDTGMEVTVIRMPLVYGPGVKANFLSMMKWVGRGIPLPFGSIRNQRSLVALDNLIDFIICCIDHPKAANEVFLICDGEDVSTTDLMYKIGRAFGKRAILLPVPLRLLRLSASLLGKGDVATRLFGSLQVDNSKAKEILGWEPVISIDDQLTKTVEAYLNETAI